jgi:cell pole-organizing protein PopZ
MAQASSAQREPSMEEILASIRRIIEDSDQGRKPAEADHNARFETSGERTEGAVIEVDAFRAELRGRLDRDHSPQMPDPAPKHSVRPVPAAGIATDMAPMQSGPVHRPERPDGEAEASALREPSPAETNDLRNEIADEPMVPEVALQETSPAPAAVIQPLGPQEPTNPAARPAIISEQAGRQVAAAFGELSEAFAASRRKSFDEMAEEMLRPMLQDWLDNNLPTLVERLVREEIERVARGG